MIPISIKARVQCQSGTDVHFITVSVLDTDTPAQVIRSARHKFKTEIKNTGASKYWFRIICYTVK